MLNDNTSPRTHRVLNIIKDHRSTGIATSELAEKIGVSYKLIRNSIETLKGNRLIKQGARRNSTAFWIPFDAPLLASKSAAKPKDYKRGPHKRTSELTQPSNGPGHTMKPLGKLTEPTSVPLRNSTKKGAYDGAELGRNPGLTPDRFEAFELPSMVNGVRVPPKRITAMCVGAPVQADAASSARRRFAA